MRDDGVREFDRCVGHALDFSVSEREVSSGWDVYYGWFIVYCRSYRLSSVEGICSWQARL